MTTPVLRHGGISICIPSYQRRDRLRRLIESLAVALETSVTVGPVEIVVCLDGSTDGSAEMLESMRGAIPCTLVVLRQRNRGRAAACNRAVEAASHRLVWLLDDDMRVSAAALEAHAAFRPSSPARVLMGPCLVGDSDDSSVSRVQEFYDLRHERLARTGQVLAPDDFSTANTSLPTALLRAEPFDPSFVEYGYEDYELGVRLLSRGETIRFEPAAAVEHDYRIDRARQLRIDRGAAVNMVKFLRKHPEFAQAMDSFRFGRLERLLMRFARPWAQRPLQACAWALDRASRLGLPRGGRCWRHARTFARMSGIAKADGREVVNELRRRRRTS